LAYGNTILQKDVISWADAGQWRKESVIYVTHDAVKRRTVSSFYGGIVCTRHWQQSLEFR